MSGAMSGRQGMMSLIKKIVESGKISIKLNEISAEGGIAVFAVFVIALVALLRG